MRTSTLALLGLGAAAARAAAPPVQGRTRLNTGAMMTLVNCGGTAPGHGGTASQDHFSNYTEWLRQGGRGIDTALTYTDPLNLKIRAAMKFAAGAGAIPRSECARPPHSQPCPAGRWFPRGV